MKIYIVGPVGSEKSTLGRRLSAVTGIPCTHLDSLVYQEDPSDPWGNTKRPEAERVALFQAVLSQDNYVMEDTGRACFEAGMRRADHILLLDPPPIVRRKRILLRWIKQRLGIEPCGYRPCFAILKAIFRCSRNYDTGADGAKDRIAQFQDKVTVLRNAREIEAYLTGLPVSDHTQKPVIGR